MALGMALWINKTPAANPDKSKLYISMKATKGPNITLNKDIIIESLNENLNLVKAIPRDINTKKIGA